MDKYRPQLDWLDAQQSAMAELVRQWAGVNSGTHNLEGLAVMRQLLAAEFAPLADTLTHRPVEPQEVINEAGDFERRPLGPALYLARRLAAPRKVLLAIHMDTVYGLDSPLQQCELIDSNTLRGPGAADAKGGLVVMLFALRALERFVEQTGIDRLGWHVLINADEELGSPGSAALFKELAPQADFGLLFEPALPGGEMVSTRKGSGNFSIVVRGRAAHAGRDFERGRNAVAAAAELAVRLHGLNGRSPGVTLNVARIEGGGPANVVPAVAVVRFNVRYALAEQEQQVTAALEGIVHEANQQEGIAAQLHGEFSAPLKPSTEPLEQLQRWAEHCGRQLGTAIRWQATGGVCDGNRLAAFGVPNLDTMGVLGGNLHSAQEFVLLDSLPQRAKLTALLLMQAADGTFPLPLPQAAK